MALRDKILTFLNKANNVSKLVFELKKHIAGSLLMVLL